MIPIFISYRRDDNISAAKLLKAILESELGKDKVFLDTTTMGPGEKWKESLKKAVTNSKVVIALIGPYWKGKKYWETNNKEDNRLLNPDDWVRLELETALQDEDKKIIPLIFYPDKVENFNDSIPFVKDTIPPSLISLVADNNKAIIHEKQFEDDLKRTIIEIVPFIKSDDGLSDLPLPDYDPQNPLDHFPEYPFKGLDYFTEKDARIFFGRGEQIKELFYKLSGNPLVLFYGQSGVGKSSLLFAGLKRRMEEKGWTIEYWRRESTLNLSEKLNEYANNTTQEKKILIILDQIEEIYTNPSKVLSPENEKFQLIESIETALKKKIHILLGFREEYLAKIQELFDAKSIRYGKMPLRHMQVKGVLEAIEGLTKSPETRYYYKLSFEAEKDVPQKIAYLVLNDKQSHVAPLLQLLLRKLWDRVAKEEEKVITEKLFDEVKSQSLKDMMKDQIKLLPAAFSDEIKSGLVLDLLYFFTTPQGSSASRTNEELKANYTYDKILDLTESLKNKYLLTDLQTDNLHTTRLAHDALAPIVRQMYSQSSDDGQRAAILLDSKKVNIKSEKKAVFSATDLEILDAGKSGMRKWNDRELELVEISRKERNKIIRQKRIRNIYIGIAMAGITILSILSFFYWQQSKKQAEIASAQEKAAQSMVLSGQPLQFLTAAQLALDGLNEFHSLETNQAARNILNRMLLPLSTVSFPDSLDGVNAVVFSKDGKYFASSAGIKNSVIKISESLTGKILKEYFLDSKQDGGSFQMATDLKFSNDNQYLGFASNGAIWIWEWESTRNPLKFENRVDAVYNYWAFNSNSKYVACSADRYDEGLAIIEISSGDRFVLNFNSEIKDIEFSPTDSLLLAVAGLSDSLFLYKIYQKEPYLKRQVKSEINDLEFDSSGNNIVAAVHEAICILNINSKKVDTLCRLNSNINEVHFSKDGESIASQSQDYTSRIWNSKTGQELSRHTFFQSPRGIAFLKDGHYFASSNRDDNVRLFSSTTGEQIGVVPLATRVTSICASHDGNYLATADDNGNAIIWQLSVADPFAILNHSEGISSVNVEENGNLIITISSSNGFLKLWNAASGANTYNAVLPNMFKENIFYDNSMSKIVYTEFSSFNNIVKKRSDPSYTFKINLPRVKRWINIHDANNNLLSTSIDLETIEPELMTDPHETEYSEIVPIQYFGNSEKSLLQGNKKNDSIVRHVRFNTPPETEDLRNWIGYSPWINNPSNLVVFALSGNGKLSAEATADIVWIVDLDKKKIISKIFHGLEVDSNLLIELALVKNLFFTKNANYLLTETKKGVFRYWDLSDLRKPKLIALTKNITPVAIKLDLPSPFIADTNNASTLYLRNPINFLKTDSFQSKGNFHSAFFNAKGDKVAIVSYDKAKLEFAKFRLKNVIVPGKYTDFFVEVWDVKKHKILNTLSFNTQINDIKFSSDDRSIVLAQENSVASIYDLLSGKEVSRILHKGAVKSVFFANKDRVIVSSIANPGSGNTKNNEALLSFWKNEDLSKLLSDRIKAIPKIRK